MSAPPDWTTAITEGLLTEGLLTVFIVTRPDQCPEEQKVFVRLPHVPNVAHNLPVESRLNPLWELNKPSGLDPR